MAYGCLGLSPCFWLAVGGWLVAFGWQDGMVSWLPLTEKKWYGEKVLALLWLVKELSVCEGEVLLAVALLA